MKKTYKLSTIVILLSASTLASASNFQLFEQSATMLGQADAGTAVSDDPSVQFYNPAATAFFDKTTVGLSGVYIAPHISYDTTAATDFSGNSISGQSFNPDQNAFVPALFLIQPITHNIVAGFGVTVPFGLSSNYGFNSMARYFATQSAIKTINLNPSLAFKFNDKFSAGFGLNAQYMSATLNQAIDGNTLFNQTIGANVNDIYIQNKATDWGYGWNAGFEYRPENSTRIGLSYRSHVRHSLSGDSTVETPIDGEDQFLLSVFGGLQDAGVSGDVTLPSYTTLSLAQDITDRWAVMADVERTNWSIVKSITLDFDNKTGSQSSTNLPPQTIQLNYHNTWRLALGQSFKLTDDLTGRMGVAYDQSPVPKEYATPRIPDSDRYWLTLGAGYKLTPGVDVNLGYAHIFFKDSAVNQSQTVTSAGQTFGPASFAAYYQGNANVVGAQINAKFG